MMSNNFLVSFMIMVVILFSGCSKDESNDTNLELVKLTALEINGCKNTSETHESVYVERDGQNLIIHHQNGLFNCCVSEINCHIEQNGPVIRIYETSERDICNCVCPFDIRMEIEADVEQMYEIIIFRNDLKIKTMNVSSVLVKS